MDRTLSSSLVDHCQHHLVQSFRWLRYFRIELFFFVFIFSVAFEDVTFTLLAQDKICMEQFGSERFCANLSKLDSRTVDPQATKAKDDVLARVTTFNLYQNLIYTVPVLVGSLFVGSWADRHRSSTKTLLVLTSLMVTLESAILFFNAIYFHLDVNLMLIAFVLFPLVGGGQSLGMASISYLSSTSSSDNRVIRFMILDLIRIVSSSLGGFCGGLLIGSPNRSQFAKANGQLHNYDQVLAIGALLKLVGFLYAVMMPFQSRPKPDPKTVSLLADTDECNQQRTDLITDGSLRTTRLSKFRHNFCDLFTMRNIAESFEVCFKWRPNGVRATLWMLLISMSIVVMVGRSAMVLMFQFVQKLYNWDAGQYSKLSSMLYLVTHLFGFLVVTPVLTKVFKISDSTLMVIGLVSYIGQKFICGTILTETAFCLSYLFGSIASLAPVAIRSKISKLVPPHELNRIFGLLTTLETLAPLVGISLYTFLFNLTISTYPGFVFQLSCFLLLIPLVLTTYIGTRPMLPASVYVTPTSSGETEAKCTIFETLPPPTDGDTDDTKNNDNNNNNNNKPILNDPKILVHIIPIQTQDSSII